MCGLFRFSQSSTVSSARPARNWRRSITKRLPCPIHYLPGSRRAFCSAFLASSASSLARTACCSVKIPWGRSLFARPLPPDSVRRSSQSRRQTGTSRRNKSRIIRSDKRPRAIIFHRRFARCKWAIRVWVSAWDRDHLAIEDTRSRAGRRPCEAAPAAVPRPSACTPAGTAVRALLPVVDLDLLWSKSEKPVLAARRRASC